jgi:predicted short-subunit dehydrogenase-like oxidoreductase (DUF2520 family)
MTIAIVGCGNVAYHMGKNFSAAGVLVNQIFCRKSKEAELLAKLCNAEQIDKLDQIQADIVIICTKDDAVLSIIQELKSNQSIIYTAGSIAINDITDKKNVGVLYPLQSLRKDKTIDFKNIPLLIEANNSNFLKKIKLLASKISDSVVEVNSDDRIKYHIAAVYLNNFVNHLAVVSKIHLDQNGLNWELMKPLIKQTMNALLSEDPYYLQTGPAIRNDRSTIEKHLILLNEEFHNLYRLISTDIYKTHNNE